MSASLVIASAVIPVSSRTSRRAASSAFSPGSTRPLGRQITGFVFGRELRRVESGVAEELTGNSITAMDQVPPSLRTTTPPAEISLTIPLQVSRNTGDSSSLSVSSGNRLPKFAAFATGPLVLYSLLTKYGILYLK